MKRLLLISLAIMMGVSCRKLVMEDRSGCPAFIFFEKDEEMPLADKDILRIEVRDADSMELLAEDRPLVSQLKPGEYWMPVEKRASVVATCICGVRLSTTGDGRLMVPYGNQGDPIYHFVHQEVLEGEQMRIPLRMQKDHSVITVRFTSYNDSFPYTVVVRANTAGIETVSGKPVEGSFRYAPLETDPGTYIFTVPRQADYTLSLQIGTKPGMTNESGHIDDIILWKSLQNIKGFNWEMENLPDIDVKLDVVRKSVSVSVNDWTIDSSLTISI